MAVPDIQVGPVGGLMLWTFIGLVILGALVAPTIGAAIVWGVVVAFVILALFFMFRRLFLRAAGRRGGSR